MKTKLVLFAVFASLMVYASAKSETVAVPTNATVTCCDPPPTCPPHNVCPPVK